ncbi:MAG TPA: hypothetical protein VGN68_19345 [Sphingopyxis sp.]|jgi:hypothetical protein|uniref:hypothetical protein n=1 Tax=Sphingopyxis sp. TaxID=1908224 RepID=UPI002E11BE79|nr:hypothetical protein [Sphingopyxis sp.]
MLQGKTRIIVLVTLVVGFTGGFILRPVIMPPANKTVVVGAAPASAQARSTQYFVANVAEARQVVAGCRDGSVRGGECTNAEEALIKVDAAERRKRFLGN